MLKNSQEILFLQSKTTSYTERTKINANYADITFAFAVDFSSKGEIFTKECVKRAFKIYVPINAKDFKITNERIEKTISFINNNKKNTKNNIILNIAGNGIYTLKKYNISQENADEFTLSFLKETIYNKNFLYEVSEIRSGGQSGFDEAGAKAGQKMGIKTSILAPKGWKYRNKNGIDISDENEFKNRFIF